MDEVSALEHPCNLAQRIGKLLFDKKTSDVILIVEGEYLPAHKAILTVSCEYFRALLHGDMKESHQNEVVLEDVPLRCFKLLMEYIYTGQLKLKELDEDTILELLGIAHLYGLATLETTLCQSLRENLSIENVCLVFRRAHLLQLKELSTACRNLMLVNPEATLRSETFCDLSEAALFDTLSQDTFCVDEIKIFRAVLQWRECNPTHADLSRVLGAIRLPLIDAKDLLTTVLDSGLISTDLLIEALRKKECNPAEVEFRGYLKSEVNLATPDSGALRLTAKDCGHYVTPRTCSGYDLDDMPPHDSEFNFDLKAGLTVALKEPSFANRISFRFCDDLFLCKYTVEISVNLVDWIQIIDHSQFSCRSLQKLYFEPRVVRYVRVIPSWTSPIQDVTELSAFEVTHVTEPFKLLQGFYAPEENVASTALGACIFKSKGVSDILIPDVTTEDAEKLNWISHVIGEGSILISLPQPYIVDSFRMLLRSDDLQAYLYYLETCALWNDWTRVADNTSDLCRSWQNIVFEPRLVRYIRIVGTASTVGQDFSCARFECPAPA